MNRLDLKLKNARILIVDDQEEQIIILTSFLSRKGYKYIKGLQDPREVMDAVITFEPNLILLDLMMPNMSGFEVMELLKAYQTEDSFIPILVLTADNSPATKQRALSLGAYDFITKPFELVEIGLRIKNMLYTSYLLQQLQNKKLLLEEKVEERTLELQQTKHELLIARDKIIASDRNKMSFILNISHEIRTPLNSILGFGAMMVKQTVSPEKKQYYEEIIRHSGIRLINTVSNFITISKIVSGNLEVKYEQADLIELLLEIRNKYQKLCEEENLYFNLIIPEDQEKLVVETDPAFVQHIIMHLLDNAIKFTNYGGVTLGFNLQTDEIQFSVKDTGIGIDEDVRATIFEGFTQADVSDTRDYQGNGLGLTIAQRMLDILGGHIWFNSVRGEGSEFYFTLPLNRTIKE